MPPSSEAKVKEFEERTILINVGNFSPNDTEWLSLSKTAVITS
jgi:hypothetical protein